MTFGQQSLCRMCGLCVTLVSGAIASHGSTARTPDFAVDVMGVLSKAGCNAGSCHGNQQGKGGLRLSLRGEDPHFDYRMLVRDAGGRRIHRLRPEESLLLRKPSGGLAHGGGVRLDRHQEGYAILLQWIGHGAGEGDRVSSRQLIKLEARLAEMTIVEPQRQAQLEVVAYFSDGSQRDVREWAIYEPSNLSVRVDPQGLVERVEFGESTIVVRYLDRQVAVTIAFIPATHDYVWTAPPPGNYVDTHVYKKLAQLKINPSPPCDDHVMLRRAYFDLLGIAPTADEARAFAADSARGKRERLIDRLLARSELADHWALKWSDILRNEEKALDSHGVHVYHRWIRESIQAGKPVDQFVRELITARGSTYAQPAANFYRAHRTATDRSESVARLFLGIRLQCARCHNHPFDRWSQQDYYGWAAVFDGIDYEMEKNAREDELDKHEFVGEQFVVWKEGNQTVEPQSGLPARPRLLGGPAIERSATQLEQVADWLTRQQPDRFARVQVNWIWYHLMGRGLVDPVDDFRHTNPASNEPLLAALAADFWQHQCDLRHLLRVVMTSHTYQASSRPNLTNARDETNYSRAFVRRWSAEQLLDSQCQILDQPPQFAGEHSPRRAVAIAGAFASRPRKMAPAPADRFLDVFGKPARLLACECERSQETTLAQALTMLADKDLQRRLSAPQGRLARWIDTGLTNSEMAEELYWWTLSRPPDRMERQQAILWLEERSDRFAALQDLAWGLLNAKEGLFRW